ncbi:MULTISPECIES: hypothetical protein [Protofrankia]|nr:MULTISPECIES: hypothetical protein [Protofrankia]
MGTSQGPGGERACSPLTTVTPQLSTGRTCPVTITDESTTGPES